MNETRALSEPRGRASPALLHQKSYPAVRSPEAVSLENLTELASFTWKSSIGEHPLVE
jgi:hypothetical protein